MRLHLDIKEQNVVALGNPIVPVGIRPQLQSLENPAIPIPMVERKNPSGNHQSFQDLWIRFEDNLVSIKFKSESGHSNSDGQVERKNPGNKSPIIQIGKWLPFTVEGVQCSEEIQGINHQLFRLENDFGYTVEGGQCSWDWEYKPQQYCWGRRC